MLKPGRDQWSEMTQPIVDRPLAIAIIGRL
jgi:hypothetical protein